MSEVTFAIAQSIAVAGDVSRNIESHLGFVGLAAARGARMLLFPELSLTGYDRSLTAADALDGSDRRFAAMREQADRHDMLIVAGAPIASARGLHIGCLVFGPGGGVGRHLKTYLHEGEEVSFVAGDGGRPLRIGDQAVGLAVCADITHREHSIDAARRGCTVYAASCFVTESGYAADAALLHEYATTHRMLVLMANYGAPVGPWTSAGRSAAWSPDGALLACAPPAGESLVVVERVGDGWTGTVVDPAG